MRIQILQKKIITVLVFMLMCICALAETKTVTYTVASTSSVSVTGDAPVGSYAEFRSTYKEDEPTHITAGNSMMLTLYGFDGIKIAGLKLRMRSNASSGSGSMTCRCGTNLLASIQTSTFKDWYGEYSIFYVDVLPEVTPKIVNMDEKMLVEIKATANSLYCESFTIEYDDTDVVGVKSIDISGTYPTEFSQYGLFSKDGIIVNALFDDGLTKDVTAQSQLQFSEYDMSDVGVQNVCVTYRGKSKTYQIKVNESQSACEVLTSSLIGLNSTTYKEFENLSFDNGISSCYKGKAALNYSSITLSQFSTNKDRYIATSASGGYVKSIKIYWNNNTASGKTLEVYGNNTPYLEPTKSNGSIIGTLIGSIKYNSPVCVLDALCKYKYMMIISKDGTSYIDKIEIEWLPNPCTRFLSVNKLGTICLPYNAGNVVGASVYEVAGKVNDDDGMPAKIYLNEASLPLVAGRPYVFVANANKQIIEMTGVSVASVAGNKNGLYGTFSNYPFSSDVNFSETNYYIINSDNEIQRASSASGVYANRAFIKMDEVPLYEPSSSRERVLVLDENGYSFEEATDISEIICSQKENDVEIYTLGGVKINDLQRGVNIVRMSDGSVNKVLKR